MKLGIACASGSAKGVFVHGVLSSFEKQGFGANLYAAASSSSIPAAFAAAHRLPVLNGAEYWKRVRGLYVDHDYDMSAAVKDGIRSALPLLGGALFDNHASRFAVAVSEVATREAAESTQGEEARKLGRRLMLSIRNHDNSWARENLVGRLFDTRSESEELLLTSANAAEVLYATTRMLHAWREPAWISGRPFVDASYTCVVPAVELADMGMDAVIAISPETGPMYRDFFQSEVVPPRSNGTSIHFIQPDQDLSELGVDYLKATDEGLDAAFELGARTGSRFLEAFER